MSTTQQMNMGRILGAVVYAERTAIKMTQRQLAEAADVHSIAISKLERGVWADVGISFLSQIAKGLGVSLASMVKRAEDWSEVIEKNPPPVDLSGEGLCAFVCLVLAQR